MSSWRPPAGTTCTVEPSASFPRHRPFVATVLDDDRLLLDVGDEALPSVRSFDAVASFVTPEAVLRVGGVLVAADVEGGQFELLVRDVEQVQRRRTPRVDIDLPVSLSSVEAPGPAVCVRGRTVNLSAGGCRVVTRTPLPPGAEPEVALDVGGGEVVVAHACVLSSEHDDTAWHYRLMFTDIDPLDRSRLLDITGPIAA